MLASAALCTLCFVSTGSAASAGGRFIETGIAGAGATNIGGPVLAGDALVWTESLGPGRSRWRLVREQDGRAREIEAYARRWLSRHPRAALRLDVNGKARAVSRRLRWPAWLTLPFSP